MIYQLVFLCGLYVWWVWVRRRSGSEPPELSGWLPLVGHGHMLIGDKVKMYKNFVKMSQECTEKGGVATLHLGLSKKYCVTDPEDCLTVMNTCLEKGFFMSFGKQFLGNGLVTADVERWHTSRKLLNPAFGQKVLDGFIDIFDVQAKNLVNKLASEVGKPFDHKTYLRENNLETICATSFEVQDSESGDFLKEYMTLFLKGLNIINMRIQKFWLHNNFIYNITGLKRELDEVARKIAVLSKMMIEKNRLKRKNIPNKNMETGKSKKFIDLILDLAEETGCFTDEQIREESDTIIIAGHDTSATTLTFALTLLGSHPDVQDKVYEEIINLCGNSDKGIEKQDLAKLVYTEAVLKETSRLYPFTLIFPRYIDRDIKLRNFTLKANSECFVLSHGLHHHSIWGSDADKFRPERWLDKNSLPNPKYYAGYGMGRRACIGKAYAIMSMKIVLAHMLRSYRVSANISNMVVSLQVFPTAESGHDITLHQR